MSDMKYLTHLEKIAEAVPAASHNKSQLRARLAACVVFKNEIVSVGVNQLKSHPFQARFGKNEDSIFLHAETDAIKNALKCISVDDLAKSTLYVCRVKYCDTKKREFTWGLSKPCAGCSRAISTFNIKKVCYTCDDGTYKYL